jgi:predicted ATPase/DNA-binding CsgD family transcriptional regulator
MSEGMRTATVGLTVLPGADGVIADLIGRSASLELVHDAAQRARAGHSTVVVVTGEAGIGKSVLLASTLVQLADSGFRVLHGRAERMEQGMAYACFRQALEPVPAGWPADARAAAHELLSSLDGHDTHWSFQDVYRAAIRILGDLCAEGPTVLALDDLHLADADTVNLLLLMARRFRTSPLLILLGRRHDTEGGRHHALDQLEEGLQGDGVLVPVPLAPLAGDEIAELVGSMLGALPDTALVEHVARRSGGNPFFAIEAVHALQKAGSIEVDEAVSRITDDVFELTPSRRRAILHRIVPVDDDARAVAMAMAAFGRLALDQLGLLAEIAQLDVERVEHGFDQLVEVNVLGRRDDGGYGFTHDLVAETLYEELGPAARRRMHARIAAAMVARRERGLPSDPVELARHLARSSEPGDIAAALAIARAGDASLVRAPHSAVRWYRQALRLLPDGAAERGAILLRFAQALLWVGSPGEAVEVCREALDRLTLPHDRDRAFSMLGEVASVSGRRAQEEVVRLIDDEIARSGTRARLLVVRAAQLGQLCRYEEAITDAEAALELSQPSTPTALQALFQLAHTAHSRGRIDLLRRYTAEQIEQSASMSTATQGYVHTWAAFHFAANALVDEARSFIEQAQVSRRASPALRTGIVLAGIWADYCNGDWTLTRQAAGEAAEEFLQLGQYTSYAAAKWVEAEIALGQGDTEPALAIQPEEHPLSPETATLLLAARAGGELTAGRPGACRMWLDRALELPRCAAVSRIHWRLIDAARAGGDQDRAVQALEDLRALVAGTRSEVLDVVLVLCEELVEPGHDLTAAIASTAELKLPFIEARLHLQAGHQGGPDARQHLLAALAFFDELEATPWRQRVARELRRQGLAVPRRSTTSRRLTESEEQIARLVADGLSNREIANELSYSVKTVQAYLSRVYTKIGVRSRVELTRLLHERGIA